MTEDKRQNEIIRIQKKRNNFVMLDKGFLEDERLSYKAKGILAYLLSKPDNWKVIIKDLINHSNDGKKAIYSGLRELKEHGYYKKIPVRDESGRRISYWESVIFECPEEDFEPPKKPPKSADKDSLVTQKGEVDKNLDKSTPSLLTPFVHIRNVDIQNGQRNNNYINNNNSSEESSQSQSQGQTQTDKTDMTPTNDFDTDKASTVSKSIPEKKVASAKTPMSNHRQAEATKTQITPNTNTQDDYNTYLEIIQGNIDYKNLTRGNRDRELVDSLIHIMLDVILTASPHMVTIDKEAKPRDIVKWVYLRLNGEHIQHVIDQYKTQRHPINHKTAYLRTMLYTVYHEIEPHVTNQVRADGLVW